MASDMGIPTIATVASIPTGALTATGIRELMATMAGTATAEFTAIVAAMAIAELMATGGATAIGEDTRPIGAAAAGTSQALVQFGAVPVHSAEATPAADARPSQALVAFMAAGCAVVGSAVAGARAFV